MTHVHVEVGRSIRNVVGRIINVTSYALRVTSERFKTNIVRQKVGLVVSS